MKKLNLSLITLAATLAITGSARADGFTCKTVEGDLKIKVYNHTQPEDGTRNVAVMVLSDPAIGLGRKTIARFLDINETLTSLGATYEANVDLRFNDSGRKGELVAGTKLGQLKTIVLDLEYSYNQPVRTGAVLPGTLELIKRDGSTISRDLECTRYLKN